MHTYQDAAYSPHHVAHAGGNVQRLLLVIAALAAFAALTGAYVFEQAGASYPEPWTQASD